MKRRLADHLRIGQVTVAAGQVTVVDEASFRNARFSEDPVKGAAATSVYSRHWSLSATGNYQAVFDRPTAQGGYFPSAPLVGAEATLHNFFGKGFSLSVDGLYGWGSGAVGSSLLGTLPYGYSLLSAGAGVLYEWNQDGTFIPFGGVHLAFNFMTRTFEDASLPAQTYSVFTPGAFAGLKVRLTHRFSVVARARFHYLLYNVDETRSLGTADFGLLLDYEFRD